MAQKGVSLEIDQIFLMHDRIVVRRFPFHEIARVIVFFLGRRGCTNLPTYRPTITSRQLI
jgi:hypothetical protein